MAARSRAPVNVAVTVPLPRADPAASMSVRRAWQTVLLGVSRTTYVIVPSRRAGPDIAFTPSVSEIVSTPATLTSQTQLFTARTGPRLSAKDPA